MNYLKKKALIYEYKASFFLSIVVVVSFALGKYLPLVNPWIYIPVFVLWLLIVVVLQFLSEQSEKKRRDYIKGDNGEKFIIEILEKLPNNYRYIPSIKLKNGNLDFLVISESGLFGIETKNQNGKITYDEKNMRLLRNYYPIKNNYLKQVKNCCFDISVILKDELKINQFINPTLVFSGLGVSIETTPKVAGVDVINSNNLISFLTKKRVPVLSQEHQDSIYKLFSNPNK